MMSQFIVSVERRRSMGAAVARVDFWEKVGLYIVFKMGRILNKSNIKDS